jgi:N-acetylglutamate synthase-like GNAT family acetyltransferase
VSGHALVVVRTGEHWAALHKLRREVLFAPGRRVRDIVYDDAHPDDRDAANTPFLLVHEGRPIGTARLDRLAPMLGAVRLVAIDQAEQRKGHGRVLGELLDAEARRVGMTRLVVNSAPDAVGYYRRLGWSEHVWDPAELVGVASDCVQMHKPI